MYCDYRTWCLVIVNGCMSGAPLFCVHVCIYSVVLGGILAPALLWASAVPSVCTVLRRLCLCSLCIQEPSTECHCQVTPKPSAPSEFIYTLYIGNQPDTSSIHFPLPIVLLHLSLLNALSHTGLHPTSGCQDSRHRERQGKEACGEDAPAACTVCTLWSLQLAVGCFLFDEPPQLQPAAAGGYLHG